MTVRYTITPYGSNQQSKPMSLGTVLRRLGRMMRHAGRARGFHLRRAVADYGPKRTYAETLSRVRILLSASQAGFNLVVGVHDDPIQPLARLRKVEIGYPVADTAGVPSIDQIYGAVYAEFNAKYGIVNSGICVNKPGEHGKCNAVDISVHKPTSAAAIHAAILDIGNWLRARMIADIEGEGVGLPVNGVIVMEQICDRSSTSWRHYSGTPHVSHVHVSGWPNLVPGWV